MSGTEFAIGLAAFLLAWYVVGLYLGRRRGGVLVGQIRDSLQGFGGQAMIRWIGRSAFRIEVESLSPPFKKLGVSVVLEPRETMLLWLVWRCFGRRDWLVVSVSADGAVKGIFDVYHPRRRGALDAVAELRALGWKPEAVPGQPDLLHAAPGKDGRALAQEVLAVLRGVEVWQIRVRHREPQLIVSLPLPVGEARVPLPIFTLLRQLVDSVVGAKRSADGEETTDA
jgi:hypothetical protein